MPEALIDQQDKRTAKEHDNVYPVASNVYKIHGPYKPVCR
jgi:hypothetical protein